MKKLLSFILLCMITSIQSSTVIKLNTGATYQITQPENIKKGRDLLRYLPAGISSNISHFMVNGNKIDLDTNITDYNWDRINTIYAILKINPDNVPQAPIKTIDIKPAFSYEERCRQEAGMITVADLKTKISRHIHVDSKRIIIIEKSKANGAELADNQRLDTYDTLYYIVIHDNTQGLIDSLHSLL